MLLVLACSSGSGGTGTPPPPPPPPAPPLAIAKGNPSGDNQTGMINTTLGAPLRVVATRGTAAAPGEPVTWSTTSGQVTGSGPTGSDGVATATWMLGGTAGTHSATAMSGNASTQFSATVTAPPQGPIVVAQAAPSGDGQTAVLGTHLPTPMRVIVTQDGAPVVGATVNWQTTAANGFLDPAATATGAGGIATSTWVLGTPLGAQAATASVGQSSVMFAATATAGPGGDPVIIHLSLTGLARFAPANVVIPVGTTVRWVWDDGPHTVTSTGFPGNPTADNPPTTYEYTFPAAGTFSFHCDVHGTPTSGMRGTVVVQ
jgi:plastocyanin